MSGETKISENPLFVSWVDSAWIPVLNQANVMDYFSERTNPFYDRTCNNEILKMQKLGLLDAQLGNMQGTEYCLLHVQEPILYVVRKQRVITKLVIISRSKLNFVIIYINDTIFNIHYIIIFSFDENYIK